MGKWYMVFSSLFFFFVPLLKVLQSFIAGCCHKTVFVTFYCPIDFIPRSMNLEESILSGRIEIQMSLYAIEIVNLRDFCE